MAVLNVTPDSFSDGGRYLDADTAVKRGIQQYAAGADIVDVGGESTRPGAQRVPAEQELFRVLPVVKQLAAAQVPVSIDTMNALVAEEALQSGAVLVNDVSGGLNDPQMLEVIAAAGVPCVLMHWRGLSFDMNQRSSYPHGVVSEVVDALGNRLEAACAAGINEELTVLDPGLGFAKESEHNWELLANLDQLQALRRPLLIGASRKRFLGALLPLDGEPRAPRWRDDATVAVSALAAAAGVWCVRVHEAQGNADAVHVAAAWRGARA